MSIPLLNGGSGDISHDEPNYIQYLMKFLRDRKIEIVNIRKNRSILKRMTDVHIYRLNILFHLNEEADVFFLFYCFLINSNYKINRNIFSKILLKKFGCRTLFFLGECVSRVMLGITLHL